MPFQMAQVTLFVSLEGRLGQFTGYRGADPIRLQIPQMIDQKAAFPDGDFDE